MRARDNQRQKVYDWEIAQGWYDGSKHMSFTDCCKLIRSAWAMYIDGKDAPEITYKQNRSRSMYNGSDHKIILNSRDNRAEATLHEVAHAIISTKMRHLTYAPHGPEFVALYITLMATYLGYDGATLRRKAAIGGVLVNRNVPFDIVNAAAASIDIDTTERSIAPKQSIPALVATPRIQMAEFRIGDRVRFRSDVKPTYMAGATGVVEKYRYKKVLVRLDDPPVGRFENGGVVAPPNMLLPV